MMGSKMAFPVLKNLLISSTFFSCFVLFGILMTDVWSKYVMKSTTIVVGVYNQNIDARPIPYVTFCPAPAFKVPGFQYTLKGYNDNTFSFEDLFHNETIGWFNVTTLDTPMRGRCYTLSQANLVRKSERVLIPLKPKVDTAMYIHFPIDSFWLNFYTPPISVKEIKIEPEVYPTLKFLDFGITEVQSEIIRSESNLCDEDKHYLMMDCVKNAVQKLESNLTCITPGIRGLFLSSKLPWCSNSTTGENTLAFLTGILHGFSMNYLGCEVPCRQNWFDSEVASFHKNTELTMNGSMFRDTINVMIYYKTLNLEVRTETLIYDVGNLLAAAGGNLGLTLGFSCFSTIIYFVNKFGVI